MGGFVGGFGGGFGGGFVGGFGGGFVDGFGGGFGGGFVGVFAGLAVRLLPSHLFDGHSPPAARRLPTAVQAALLRVAAAPRLQGQRGTKRPGATQGHRAQSTDSAMPAQLHRAPRAAATALRTPACHAPSQPRSPAPPRPRAPQHLVIIPVSPPPRPPPHFCGSPTRCPHCPPPPSPTHSKQAGAALGPAVQGAGGPHGGRGLAAQLPVADVGGGGQRGRVVAGVTPIAGLGGAGGGTSAGATVGCGGRGVGL